MAWYVAQIADQNGRVAVSFPDISGVCAVNATLERAVEAAGEALAWAIESWRAKGINAPAPTPLDLLHARGGASSYVLVEV